MKENLCAHCYLLSKGYNYTPLPADAAAAADATFIYNVVYALLALYKDPNTSSNSSTADQTKLPRSALITHESAKKKMDGKLWCPIMRNHFDERKMRAARIVLRALWAGLVDYILGAGTGSRLNTSDNCMILDGDAEYAFAISGKDWGLASPIRETSVTVNEAFEMT